MVWGGAWTVGYKAWPFILAQDLANNGVLCVVIDYRNFPQGNIEDMVEDVDNAMKWVFENISSYNGDLNNISLIGQSAGAHIAILSTLFQALVEKNHVERKWQSSRLRNFIGVSGAYDLETLQPAFDKHGLSESLFRSIMNNDLHNYSPKNIITEKFRDRGDYSTQNLPPITLIHGTRDKTIDSSYTMDFEKKLVESNIPVKTQIFPNKSHTDFFLEDLIEGIGEDFVKYLLGIIHGDTYIMESYDQKQKRFTHPFFVNIGRIVNPF